MSIVSRPGAWMIVFAGMAILAGISGCTKGTTSLSSGYNKAFYDAIDAKILDTFIVNHPSLAGIRLDAVKTTSTGLRYTIVGKDFKDSASVTPLSSVVFSYSLRIPGKSGLADSVPNPITSVGYGVNPLNSTISGLVEGLQLIHKGGHILLFIPSSLGFRNQEVNVTFSRVDQTQTVYTIKPNTVLIFNINLTAVRKF